MEREDREIRNEMRKVDIQVPESFEKHIDVVLSGLKEKGGSGRRLLPAKAAAVLAGVLIVLGGAAGVGAAVSSYQRHMDEMSREEMERYVEDVQKSETQADVYSRELTADEERRKNELCGAYESGKRFPESEIRQIRSYAETENGQLSFFPEESKFFLPERALTDEELLQIIDLQEKRDYSLREKNKESAGEDSMAEEANGKAAKKRREESCVRAARTALEKFYQISLRDAKETAGEDEMPEEEASVSCEVEFERDGKAYTALVDMDTEEAYDLSCGMKGKEAHRQGVRADERDMREKCRGMKKQLRRILPEGSVVSEWKFDYNITEQGELGTGVFKLSARMRTGDVYIMVYSYSLGAVYHLYHMDSYEKFRKSERRKEKSAQYQNAGLKVRRKALS